MLDTVLEIGRVLRAAPDGLKHHRFIKRAPVPDEKRNPVRFWVVPVSNDGSFDFTDRETLINENLQKRLFYLNYKKSDADSTKPYMFGDVYRTVTKTGEDGNFRFGDPTKGSWMARNSFERAGDIEVMPTDRVRKFRVAFRAQLEAIEGFLRDNQNVYIHFDFGGKAWNELEEVELLNRNLLNVFFESTKHGYVMRSYLYKTLVSDTRCALNFRTGNEFKGRAFCNQDEAMDLLYGVNYASSSIIRKNDIKIVVLPRGKNLTARQIERFFDRSIVREPDDKSEDREGQLRRDAESSPKEGIGGDDELFEFLTWDEDLLSDILQFDFIFSKAGGTQPDIDMIELSGLDRSKLSHIGQRVRERRKTTEDERSEYLTRLFGKEPQKLWPLRITQSFLGVLGDTTRAKKKYQSHLLRVLPQIYTETYFQDPVLLPALIEKTELNIRNGEPNFNLLKFDYYFLVRLQNHEGDRVMAIKDTPSYRVGALLGRLAKQFSGLNSPIKSFEKNYVGLLSRRITTLDDVIKLSNEINQKLIMHERAKYTFRISADLAEEIKNFAGRYDKNECAFGFFESYFALWPTKAEHGEEDEGGTTEGEFQQAG